MDREYYLPGGGCIFRPNITSRIICVNCVICVLCSVAIRVRFVIEFARSRKIQMISCSCSPERMLYLSRYCIVSIHLKANLTVHAITTTYSITHSITYSAKIQRKVSVLSREVNISFLGKLVIG